MAARERPEGGGAECPPVRRDRNAGGGSGVWSAMHVHAHFFASYRELVGTDGLRVELGEGSTVGDLVRALRGRGAPFDRLPEDPAIAVNLELVDAGTALRIGDEVAFLPPVAGG